MTGLLANKTSSFLHKLVASFPAQAVGRTGSSVGGGPLVRGSSRTTFRDRSSGGSGRRGNRLVLCGPTSLEALLIERNLFKTVGGLRAGDDEFLEFQFRVVALTNHQALYVSCQLMIEFL